MEDGIIWENNDGNEKKRQMALNICNGAQPALHLSSLAREILIPRERLPLEKASGGSVAPETFS